MKALILAAGLGTRLSPYTENTPKPLFTLSGRPLLDIIISGLIDADCKAIVINNTGRPVSMRASESSAKACDASS